MCVLVCTCECRCTVDTGVGPYMYCMCMCVFMCRCRCRCMSYVHVSVSVSVYWSQCSMGSTTEGHYRVSRLRKAVWQVSGTRTSRVPNIFSACFVRPDWSEFGGGECLHCDDDDLVRYIWSSLKVNRSIWVTPRGVTLAGAGGWLRNGTLFYLSTIY